MEIKAGSWFLTLFVIQLPHISAKTVTEYFRSNGYLSFSPTAVPVTITSILWRHEENLVAEWIEDAINLRYYGEFENRTQLSITTGKLTITPATEADNGLFSVEINNVALADLYEAKMIEVVPDPNLWVKPGVTSNMYNLYCDPVEAQETLAAAQPVSYRWKIGTGDWVEFGRKVDVEVNETTRQAETFMCRMVNPVSEKDSKPTKNPFHRPGPPPGLVGGVVGGVSTFLIAFGSWGIYAYKKKKFPFRQSGNAQVSQSEEGKELKSTEANTGSP